MPISFILLIILGIISIVCVLAWVGSKNGPEPVPGIVPVIAISLTFLVFLFTILTIVPTRTAGVVVSFGKPTRSLDNGLHAKLPWEKVKKLDGTIKTNARTGSDAHPTGDDGASCTDIRIGNGSIACVDNSVRWRIKTSAAKELYKDYPKGIDNIRDNLIKRQTTAALNDVLGEYNPLNVIQDKSGEAEIAPNLEEFSKQVKQRLETRVGDDVEIIDVILPIVRLDKSTQSKINLYQAEVANTRIAQQRKETAIAQAAANRELKASVDNSPNVLVAQCLDTLGEMVKNKQSVPAGFTCWPGGSSGIVIPATK